MASKARVVMVLRPPCSRPDHVLIGHAAHSIRGGAVYVHDSVMGSCAGSSFRVPASDRPGVWSGTKWLRTPCQVILVPGDGRSWVRTLWAHPCPCFPVPSILRGGRHVKVARQGPSSPKALVCSILEMSKAGSGSSSPSSLGVGTRIGSVLAVSMTLRHRSSHRLSEFVLSSASDGGGSRSSMSSKGCWGEGWEGAGRGGGESRRGCRGRGHAGVVAASAGWGVRLLPRLLLWPGLSLVLTAPVACVAGAVAALAPVACTVALRWVSPRLVPPAWRGPLRLVGVPSGSAPGSGTLGGVGLRGSMWSRGPGCGVGGTCAGRSVSGGRWGCGAIAWSGGGAVRGNDRLELRVRRVVCRRGDLSCPR